MKICYAIDYYTPHVGGMETMFQEFALGMREKGHEIRVVTCSWGGTHGHKQADGVDVYYQPWNILMGHPMVSAHTLIEHVAWADVVHTGTHTAALSAQRAARSCKKPIIITIPEIAGEKWKWIEPNPIKAFLFRQFERYVADRDYDMIHVISEATKRDFITYIGHQEKVKTVYLSLKESYNEELRESSFDLHQCFAQPPERGIILYFGRPGQSKGIFVYLDAIISLVKQYGKEIIGNYRFCFLISNDPLPQKETFIQMVEREGLEDVVFVHDPLPRNDLIKGISQSDIVVVPSLTEGFGFSAAEACMLDRKIIHSDGGSLPEVVSGQTLAFRNRDSGDLCEKLRLVCEGKAVFTHSPKKYFRAVEMVSQMEEIYRELVSSG